MTRPRGDDNGIGFEDELETLFDAHAGACDKSGALIHESQYLDFTDILVELMDDLNRSGRFSDAATFASLAVIVRTLGKYWLEIVELPGDSDVDGHG